ncbi:chondroitinase-AC-like [Eriocheir sinensis]|uniref:chondroitinase-AC-like n=1 Tax=Eriocheir sinensis TaxID=95602 RepID=UPI0021CAD4C8|nr:chondroitinase-AC-like [Eriocheir sinensis]
MACFTGLLIIWATCVAAQTDWDIVENNVFISAKETARKTDPDDITALMNEDGSFSDFVARYGTVEDQSFAFREHAKRLGALAYHHVTNNDRDMSGHITKSFNFLAYKAPVNQDKNQWAQYMGIPLDMWSPLVLSKGIISKVLQEAILDRYWMNTPAGPVWNLTQFTGAMSGANLGSRALTTEVRATLSEGEKRNDIHSSVMERLHQDLADMNPYGDNGLRPDGCIHQHNKEVQDGNEHFAQILHMIYNGSYGREMLMTIGTVFTWFDGTSLNFDNKTIENLIYAFTECQQWLFRGKTFEPTTTGRFITRGNVVTKWATRGGIETVAKILQKLQLGKTNYNKEILKNALHRYAKVTPDPAYALVGNKYFFNSDLTVHQRREFMASVRVLSLRTSRQESWENLNSQGYFQGDGFLTVLVDSLEYGKPEAEVFQVYDWARVPGVTNLYAKNVMELENQSGLSTWRYFYNNASFVGGVTDGMIGLTSMVYNRPSVQLKAQKSWFFFDDVILVVGSEITLPDDGKTGESVITTLAQVCYEGSNVIQPENGQEITQNQDSEDLTLDHPRWLHHRRIGYVFLNGDERLTVKSHTDSSKDINVFTAYLDHGPLPKDVSLTYAVLPAADLDKTRRFSENPDVEVLSQTASLHAACHHPSKTLGAALFEAGDVTAACGGAELVTLSVDLPCLALLTIGSSEISVTVADPQQKYKTLTVTVTRGESQIQQLVELPMFPRRGSSMTFVVMV